MQKVAWQSDKAEHRLCSMEYTVLFIFYGNILRKIVFIHKQRAKIHWYTELRFISKESEIQPLNRVKVYQ